MSIRELSSNMNRILKIFRRVRIIRGQFLIFIFIILCSDIIYADAGNSGMAFLKIPSSARSAATMTVFSQMSGAPSSLFENPVGIKTDHPYFTFSHNVWFADVSGEVIALSLPSKRGAFACGLNFVRIPGIEVRDKPSNDPLNTIEAQYLTAALGYSHSIFNKLELGGTIKYLYESLYTECGRGAALDVGVQWNAPSSLDISLLIQNLGFMSALYEEKTALPLIFQIGIVRPEIFVEGPLNASVGLNLGSNLTTGESRAQVGAEIGIKKILFIRGGFEHIGSINRSSLGFGLKVKRFQLDYALLFMPEGLGYPYLITLTYRPGK